MLYMTVSRTVPSRRRPWWRLALVSAAAFFVAGALGMGPPFFFAIAAAGALPAVVTVRGLARVDRGATALFVGLACAFGLAASLAKA